MRRLFQLHLFHRTTVSTSEIVLFFIYIIPLHHLAASRDMLLVSNRLGLVFAACASTTGRSLISSALPPSHQTVWQVLELQVRSLRVLDKITVCESSTLTSSRYWSAAYGSPVERCPSTQAPPPVHDATKKCSTSGIVHRASADTPTASTSPRVRENMAQASYNATTEHPTSSRGLPPSHQTV